MTCDSQQLDGSHPPQGGESLSPFTHGFFDDTLKATSLTRTLSHPYSETRPGILCFISARRRSHHHHQIHPLKLQYIPRRYSSCPFNPHLVTRCGSVAAPTEDVAPQQLHRHRPARPLSSIPRNPARAAIPKEFRVKAMTLDYTIISFPNTFIYSRA